MDSINIPRHQAKALLWILKYTHFFAAMHNDSSLSDDAKKAAEELAAALEVDLDLDD